MLPNLATLSPGADRLRPATPVDDDLPACVADLHTAAVPVEGYLDEELPDDLLAHIADLLRDSGGNRTRTAGAEVRTYEIDVAWRRGFSFASSGAEGYEIVYAKAHPDDTDTPALPPEPFGNQGSYVQFQLSQGRHLHPRALLDYLDRDLLEQREAAQEAQQAREDQRKAEFHAKEGEDALYVRFGERRVERDARERREATWLEVMDERHGGDGAGLRELRGRMHSDFETIFRERYLREVEARLSRELAPDRLRRDLTRVTFERIRHGSAAGEMYESSDHTHFFFRVEVTLVPPDAALRSAGSTVRDLPTNRLDVRTYEADVEWRPGYFYYLLGLRAYPNTGTLPLSADASRVTIAYGGDRDHERWLLPPGDNVEPTPTHFEGLFRTHYLGDVQKALQDKLSPYRLLPARTQVTFERYRLGTDEGLRDQSAFAEAFEHHIFRVEVTLVPPNLPANVRASALAPLPLPAPVSAQSKDTCAICLKKLTGGTLTLQPCGHRFHRRCVVPWLRSQGPSPTCPLCRSAVDVRRIAELAPPAPPTSDRSVVITYGSDRRQVEAPSIVGVHQLLVAETAPLRYLLHRQALAQGMRYDHWLSTDTPFATVVGEAATALDANAWGKAFEYQHGSDGLELPLFLAMVPDVADGDDVQYQQLRIHVDDLKLWWLNHNPAGVVVELGAAVPSGLAVEHPVATLPTGTRLILRYLLHAQAVRSDAYRRYMSSTSQSVPPLTQVPFQVALQVAPSLLSDARELERAFRGTRDSFRRGLVGTTVLFPPFRVAQRTTTEDDELLWLRLEISRASLYDWWADHGQAFRDSVELFGE
jgi:hypothetical protein